MKPTPREPSTLSGGELSVRVARPCLILQVIYMSARSISYRQRLASDRRDQARTEQYWRSYICTRRSIAETVATQLSFPGFHRIAWMLRRTVGTVSSACTWTPTLAV